ncbi:MAG: MutS N-terminal domain-containing protein, partial [Planctomycetota bacterium]
MAPPLTPLTRQYLDLKRKNPDALLFFRCGDFYELFFDDAREASERLGISLTARHKEKDGSGGVPMAGVPHHSVEPYIKRLLDQGCRVAIAEQLSDPKQTKGLVERGVVEVVTPGTVTAWSMLDERRANHVLAIAPARTGSFGLAWLEVTTGRLVVTDVPEQAILDEVARVEPSEVLIPDDERGDQLTERYGAYFPHSHRYAAFAFAPKDGRRSLHSHLGVKTLKGFGCVDLGPALGAAGAL